MITVVGVRFKKAGKIYYFDPDHLDIQKEDNVIVETARGIEFGHVVIGKRDVSEEEIVSPLKKVLRIASSEDVVVHEKNKEKNGETFSVCEEKIRAHDLDMKLIDVEYTFDNNKVIFYFTADGRIDFRELVKDLAAVFKTRIELRQIGVRDEAKMVNGIGPCGVGLCCANWLGDFAPVSIKMAKDQNLSLNPTKISGICGRLMCCLKYEHDTYLYLRKGMPNRGDRVLTEEGPAVVFDTNILLESIKVRHIVKEREENPELGEDIVTYKKDQIKAILKKSAQVEESDRIVIEGTDEIPKEFLAENEGELKQKGCKGGDKKCGCKGGDKKPYQNNRKPNRDPLPAKAQEEAVQRAKTFAKTVAVSENEPVVGAVVPAKENVPRDNDVRKNAPEAKGNRFDKKARPRPDRKPKQSLEDYNGELDRKEESQAASKAAQIESEKAPTVGGSQANAGGQRPFKKNRHPHQKDHKPHDGTTHKHHEGTNQKPHTPHQGGKPSES
jgi:cell fate regulator YaaT (PSP1 superfamily)